MKASFAGLAERASRECSVSEGQMVGKSPKSDERAKYNAKAEVDRLTHGRTRLI